MFLALGARERGGAGALKPAWPRVSTFEYAVTAVSAPAALLVYFEVPDAAQPRWTGGILLDDIIRRHLRQTTPEGRDAARTGE